MKKNDYILISIIALYSFLFFEQSAGINFTLFNLALITGLLAKEKGFLKNATWKMAAIGSLLTSFCVAYFGNTLSVIANVISLSILSGISVNKDSSVVLSIVFSFYSYITAPVFIFLDNIKTRNHEPIIQTKRGFKRIILIAVPLLITLLFFFLYRASNPLFNEFSKTLNFDFISVTLIFTLLSGSFLVYGFFHHKIIPPFSDIDVNPKNLLLPKQHRTLIFWGREFGIEDELFSGKLLFGMLNALLLIVNLLDVNFIFISGKLPEGISYSEFVHQGIGILILSILLAIAVILFYFRGSLNFSKEAKSLKILAYLWIAQNAFLLLSTSFRNELYIFGYGLTYKRIGVYIYLLITLLGLITTFIKIKKQKTNIFLFRVNGWLFYGVLVVSCFFNWDSIITDFNIHRTQRLDKDYLLSLSYSNLPQLFYFEQVTSRNTNTNQEQKQQNEESKARISNAIYPIHFDEHLCEQLTQFLIDREAKGWRSFTYDNYMVYEELMQMVRSQKIYKLNLTLQNTNSIQLFRDFNSVTDLKLKQLVNLNFSDLATFTNLKKLDVEAYQPLSIAGIRMLKNLEYLDLSKCYIWNFTQLKDLTKLKELHLGTITQEQLNHLQYELPSTKIVVN